MYVHIYDAVVMVQFLIDGFIELDDEKLLLEILSNLIENKINQ